MTRAAPEDGAHAEGKLAGRLKTKRIVIVAGSGGVGKTTTSAALALGLAAAGQRVAVVTIDPARRLAQSLGLEELGNEPHLVDPALLEPHGIEMRGELWAMMLDPKATFDRLIERLSPDDTTRDDVLGNRIYQELSSAVAGSQEFTAVAKLYELDREGGFDVLVLDTPPSRNALDFLDAPDRLTGFFEGRALKLMLAPTSFAAKVMGRGASIVFGALKVLTGIDLLQDLSVFFRSLSGLTDGFKERAAGVKALLEDPATTFFIVTSPERGPAEEAIFFRAKLAEARMPFGGLIVNRAHLLADEAAGDDDDELSAALGPELARKIADNEHDAHLIAARDAVSIAHLKKALREEDPVVVPELDDDVHDIDGLLAVCRALWAD